MRIAIKKLTMSDLSLFRAQFRLHGTSKQKAINLNADIMDGMFAGLRSAVARAGRLGHPLSLRIFGPGALPAAPDLKRKVVKSPGSKNLRLNGELVPDPDAEPNRYGALAGGDIAVMVFDGEGLPALLNLVLLSSVAEEDTEAYENAQTLLGSQSMVLLSEHDLAAARAGVPADHPMAALLDPDTAEDDLISAVEGVAGASEAVKQRRRTRPVTAEEMARARERAAEVGREGEALYNDWLQRELDAINIAGFRWASDTNAVEAFDFEVDEWLGPERHDVKTTTGDFGRPFHMSMAEVECCASAPRRYRIVRIWGLDTGSLMMARSEDLREWADHLLGTLGDLPVGVIPDGFTIQPRSIRWDEPIVLPVPTEDDAER